MTRRAARVTQADLNRAAKAARATGCIVEVKIDGTIVLRPERDSVDSGERQKEKVDELQEAVL